MKQKEESGKILDGLDLNPTNTNNSNPYAVGSYYLPQNKSKQVGTNIYGLVSPSQQSIKVNRA